MKRLLFCFFPLALLFAAALVPAAPAAASGLLPHIRLPRINVGKAAEALTYPVTKTVVNGGKTVLKVGAAADGLGLVPNIGPPAVSHVVKKALWGFGKH